MNIQGLANVLAKLLRTVIAILSDMVNQPMTRPRLFWANDVAGNVDTVLTNQSDRHIMEIIAFKLHVVTDATVVDRDWETILVVT